MNRRVEINFGSQANNLLQDKEFIRKWLCLYDRCSYATIFQNPDFLCSWYEVYGPEWQPVVITSYDTNENLTALWLLAYSSSSNTIAHAGVFQAEYYTWLALPNESSQFISTAWPELRKKFRFSTLRFSYLPTTSLIEIFQTIPSIARSFIVRKENRPIRKLNIEELKKSIAKIHNKSKFRKLKNLGTLKFSRITETAELEKVLPELIDFYDFRQGAVHGSTPFQNDKKKYHFLTQLFMSAPDKVLFTVTYLNNNPIAGMIGGMINGKMVHLGVIVHSPFLTEFSIGKLHLIQLHEHLINEGYELLDLTPGGDLWKERFANMHDEAALIILYKSSFLCFFLTRFNKLKKFLKFHLRSFDKIKTILKKLTRLHFSKVIYKIKKWIKEERELRIYRLERSVAPSFDLDKRIKCNSISDLLAFEPAESWQQNQHEFLSSAQERFKNKEFVYTITIDNCLAFFCWLKRNQTHSFVTEVKEWLSFPAGSVIFYDAYTHPKFRRKGLYEAALAHMIHEAFSFQETKYVYGFVLSKNSPSRNMIEKIGEYQGSIFWRRRFCFENKWHSQNK